jgi:hypothetical protein
VNNISEWFFKQKFSTKIAVATALRSNDEVIVEPDPVITNQPVETPTPTVTATPEPEDPREVEDEHAEGGGHNEITVKPNSTWTIDDIDTLQNFLGPASIEYCHIIFGETDEARHARLSPYFGPESPAMQPNQVIPVIQAQQCSDLGTTAGLTEDETGYLNATTTVSRYTVYVAAQEEDRVAEQAYHSYNYKLTMRDGKWVIVDNE